MSILLAAVSTTPVPVQATGTTRAVMVRPLRFPNQFLIYDATGALQGPIANDTYTFMAPVGESFTPGQVVGYVAVAVENGTFGFEIEDQHGTAFDSMRR